MLNSFQSQRYITALCARLHPTSFPVTATHHIHLFRSDAYLNCCQEHFNFPGTFGLTYSSGYKCSYRITPPSSSSSTSFISCLIHWESPYKQEFTQSHETWSSHTANGAFLKHCVEESGKCDMWMINDFNFAEIKRWSNNRSFVAAHTIKGQEEEVAK